jgi:predicted DNA-binding transcriptional regulator AlpA
MPAKAKHKPQVAAARKAAAVKAASESLESESLEQVELQNLKARVAAKAYAVELERRPRLLTRHEVLARIRVTYPTLWQMIRDGKFPRARIVLNKSLWLEHEVDAWIEALPLRRLKGQADGVKY